MEAHRSESGLHHDKLLDFHAMLAILRIQHPPYVRFLVADFASNTPVWAYGQSHTRFFGLLMVFPRSPELGVTAPR